MKFQLCVFTCLISIIQSSTSYGQEIEIIEVSAQKRSQDIRDVTSSISVLDGIEVSSQHLKDTTALSAMAPNFKISQNAAEGTPPAINIRGVGSIDYNTSTQSPVGVYLDGSAGASANAQLVNLFDIKSVQILRGPQGTLFGRNTTGGAVLIESNDALFENSGYVNFAYGQRQHTALEGAINRQISSNVAARLAINHQDYQYSTQNLFPNTPQAKMKQSHARLSFYGQWEKLTLNTKVNLGKWRGVVNPPGSLGVVKSFDPATGLPNAFCRPEEVNSNTCTNAFGFKTNSNDFHDVMVNNNVNQNSPHETDSLSINVNARYQLNEKTYLTSVSSLSKLDRIHFYNSDASPARLGEGKQDVETHTMSQELRLHHQSGDIHLTTGLYFLKEELLQDNHFDLLRDLRDVDPLWSNAVTFFYDNDIDIHSTAIFGHLEYPLSDKTTLNAGLRYNKESTDYTALGLVNVTRFVSDHEGQTFPSWDARGKVKDNNQSGKLALHHAFSDKHSGFISVSRGFKSGGYNGALISSAAEAANNEYGAETLNAYEIGLHSKLSSNVRLYSAGFYYDYQDQQIFMNRSAVTPGAPPLQLITNVGESSIYGLEFELDAHITSQLTSKLSFGYIPKANLDSFVDELGNKVTNNRLPFTSKWNMAAQLDYRTHLGAFPVHFNLNADYQSEFYFDQKQSEYAKQDGYILWNARASWENDDISLGIWIKNITDEKYSHLKFDLVNLYGMLQDFKGEARQAGIDIRYEF